MVSPLSVNKNVSHLLRPSFLPDSRSRADHFPSSEVPIVQFTDVDRSACQSTAATMACKCPNAAAAREIRVFGLEQAVLDVHGLGHVLHWVHGAGDAPGMPQRRPGEAPESTLDLGDAPSWTSVQS